MTRRCHDWTPLGHNDDPIPGDPEQVTHFGNRWQSLADLIKGAADNLRRINAGPNRTNAMDQAMTNALALATRLDSVHPKYSQAGHALLVYAPKLAEAQHMAEQAVLAAGPAKTEQDQAASNAHDLWWGMTTNLDENQRAAFADQYHSAVRRKTQAKASLDAAKNKLAEAIRTRDEAAAIAQRAVEEAAGAGVRDSPGDVASKIWNDFIEGGKAFIEEAAKVAQQWKPFLDGASVVLGAAGLVAAVIPGAQPIAGALLILSRGTAGAALACDVISLAGQAVKAGDGRATWGSVGVSAVGVVAGFAAGKLSGFSVKRTITNTNTGTALRNSYKGFLARGGEANMMARTPATPFKSGTYRRMTIDNWSGTSGRHLSPAIRLDQAARHNGIEAHAVDAVVNAARYSGTSNAARATVGMADTGASVVTGTAYNFGVSLLTREEQTCPR